MNYIKFPTAVYTHVFIPRVSTTLRRSLLCRALRASGIFRIRCELINYEQAVSTELYDSATTCHLARSGGLATLVQDRLPGVTTISKNNHTSIKTIFSG